LKAAHCLPIARRRLTISDPDAVTLVTLSDVTDAATMQVNFLWRKPVVKHATLFAALGCVALAAILTGCGAFKGTTNNLQSIQLSTSNTGESPAGTLNLQGIGATAQLYTWGNYTSGIPKLLNDVAVTYQIAITPGSAAWTGTLGDPNADPPQTVQLAASTGLLTAVTPFACTWINTATTGTSPAWALEGTYTLTSTYKGLTSPPVYLAVASAGGITSTTNPSGECGPQTTP
jgi:hypothetical protein